MTYCRFKLIWSYFCYNCIFWIKADGGNIC